MIKIWIFFLIILANGENDKTGNDESFKQTECYTQGGAPYNGTLNHTARGEPCLPWSQFLHLRLRNSWNASVLREQSNYCRNPDDDLRGPWCMVSRAKYGTCAVPHCEHLVDCYEGVGEDYYGDASIADNDKVCEPWSTVMRLKKFDNAESQNLQILNFSSPDKYEVVSLFKRKIDGFRSCRNPGAKMSKPWCYTSSMSNLHNWGSMVDHQKSLCKINECDRSSHMGLPLDFGDECPAGFMTQVGKTIYKESEISTVYCVLSSERLREIESEKFKSFCMFLLNQNRETCPKGFEMKRTFMRTGMKNKGKYSMFRQEGSVSVWLTVCCTNGSHIEKRTKYPNYKLAYKENGNLPLIRKRIWLRGNKKIKKIKPHLLEENLNRIVRSSNGQVSKDVPIFLSIERCPGVEGTKRKIFTIGTLRTSNLTSTLLDHGYYTSFCIYYEDNSKSQLDLLDQPKKLIPSILIEGKLCPPKFKKASSFKIHHMFTYLRTAFILCMPENVNSMPLLPDGDQCFISHTTPEKPNDNADQTVFECPDEFDQNELIWSGKNASDVSPEGRVHVYFCCRSNTDESKRDKTTKQYPMPSYLQLVPSFATLILGNVCPVYMDGTLKLTADYIPVMQTKTYAILEMKGRLNPVDFIDSTASVRGVLALCKYSQPREEIGIMSVNGLCDNFGYRKVPTFHTIPDMGAVCAVNVSGLSFPKGSYCFYKTSKICPPGLPELQTSVFNGLVRNFLLQTMLSPSAALIDEKELCCQATESLGAVRFPLNITSLFALPTLQSSCQAFIGFTVDQSKGLCEYTPVTENPQTTIVWPRRVFPSNLRGKTEISLLCDTNEAFRRISKRQYSMVRLRKLWLVPTAMQGFSSNDAMELCFSEIQGARVPYADKSGPLNYCIVVFAVCPNDGFEVVSAFPYQQFIVCCTKKDYTPSSSNDEVITWPENTKTMVTLGRKRPGDEIKVRDLTGPTEIHRELKVSEVDDGCPTFERFSLLRRFVKMWKSKRYKATWLRLSVQMLLNATGMHDNEAIANRTGMWIQDDLLHVIFCEYHSNQPANIDNQTYWPLDNYAIPKPVSGCPPKFTTTDFVHYQGRNGFHYSQPIHLDGDFIYHSRAVKLHYCQREYSATTLMWNKRYTNLLPAGHYCVLLVGRHCPAGFTSGSFSVLEGLQRDNDTFSTAENTNIGTVQSEDSFRKPRIFHDKFEKGDSGLKFDRVTYMFCCRADSASASIPINGFPSNTGPFYLYRAGETCQEIAGLRVKDEYVCMDSPEFLLPNAFEMEVIDRTYHIEGFTPTVSMSSDNCNVKINLCYYEPTLPESEPEESIEQNNGSFWPAGSYSLITTIRENSSTACPPGFYLDIRENIRPDVIANTFFRPMSFSEYFTGKTPQEDIFNISKPVLHTCRRIQTAEDKKLTSFPVWPHGNYCVLMDLEIRACPLGLHRYTRQLAELCCHTETKSSSESVNLPFFDDFFLMGAFDEPDIRCLSIANTHVEKYVVLLFSSSSPHIHSLCHYLPLAWLNRSRPWPVGDYLLPIGKRGQQLPSLMTEFGTHVLTDRPKFECPAEFHRVQHEYELFDKGFGEDNQETEIDTGTSVTIDFCQHRDIDNPKPLNKGESVWPKGDYCVIVMSTICPMEMYASNEIVMRVPRSYLKSIRNTTVNGVPIGPNTYFPTEEHKVTYYSVCCRKDKLLLMDLPSFSGGMYMPAGSRLCSSIPGTFIEHEQVTTYLDPTLLDPYTSGDLDDEIRVSKQRHLPAPFEEPGIMTLCYYHQMQSVGNGSVQPINVLQDMLEPGSTALSLWLAGECGCAENAFCRPFKKFSCKCINGYFGDGIRACHQITPATDSCANLCHKFADCRIRIIPSLLSRKKEETSCVCRDGFVGDGFNCLPQCSTHTCQPFSRCRIVAGAPTCECVSGTIQDGDRCNFDLYSSLNEEKDLPQYMVQHLSCFNDEVVKSLTRQTPKRYFILFAPPMLLETCSDIRSHIIMLSDIKQFSDLKTNLITELQTLNGSFIQINTTTETLINGKPMIEKSVAFTNGRLFYTANKLKYNPGSLSSRINIVGLSVSLFLLLLLGLILGGILLRKKRPELFRFKARTPRFQRASLNRASWRGSGAVLIAPDEYDPMEF